MRPRFTATELRLAAECPRLFRICRELGGRALFVPPDSRQIGSLFHRLIHHFLEETARHPPRPASTLGRALEAADPAALLAAFAAPYRRSLWQRLARPPGPRATSEAWHAFHGVLASWCRRIASNRAEFSAATVLGRTFPGGEPDLAGEVVTARGERVALTGRPDGVLYAAGERRFLVVEFKTYRPADPVPQLLQLAAYARLLRQQSGVPAGGSLYWVGDGPPECLELSGDALDALGNRLIDRQLAEMLDWAAWAPGARQPPPPLPMEHELCRCCPRVTACQQLFGENWVTLARRGPPPTPAPTPGAAGGVGGVGGAGGAGGAGTAGEGTAEEAALVERLAAVLQGFGVAATVDPRPVVGPGFVRLRLVPAPGTRVQRLLELRRDLATQLALPELPLLAVREGAVTVDVARRTPELARFHDYLRPAARGREARLALGVDLDRRVVEAALDEPATCHFLVAGTTGSGKSVLLRSLACSLLLQASPAEIRLLLIDTKRLAFRDLAGSPWLHAPLIDEAADAVAALGGLVGEMERRYQIFRELGVDDLAHCPVDRAPPRLVCLIDEYFDLTADPALKGPLEAALKRLGAKSRGAGIHLVVATQRPEASVVTPLLRSNLPARLALRCASARDSKLVLDEPDAADLRGHGDLLYRGGGVQTQRLQALLIEPEEIARLAGGAGDGGRGA